MKELFALIVVGILAVTGCSRDEPPETDMTIHVSDTAGVATTGITVVANRHISPSQVEQIAQGTTGDDGNTTLSLPENATVAIGLWKQQDGKETVYTWQTPFVVPSDQNTLSYSYNTPNCPVVVPDEPCPTLSPTLTE